MHTKLLRLALAAFLLATGACSKKSAPHPNAILQVEADAIAALSPSDEFRNVEFDDNFVLLGVSASKVADSLELQLAWKSAKKQKMEYLVVLHALDQAGKILSQADYKQSKERSEIAAGAIWRDVVHIPYEKLAGAVNLGIGLMDGPQKWLLADRGPRNWDDRRLLFPLPKDLPAKPAGYVGFLEAANAKSIVGWVWNRDDPSKRVEIEILDGAKSIGKMTADAPRADLQKGKIGDANYGFVFETPAELKDGQPHEIHVRIAGEGFELKNSPKILQGK